MKMEEVKTIILASFNKHPGKIVFGDPGEKPIRIRKWPIGARVNLVKALDGPHTEDCSSPTYGGNWGKTPPLGKHEAVLGKAETQYGKDTPLEERGESTDGIIHKGPSGCKWMRDIYCCNPECLMNDQPVCCKESTPIGHCDYQKTCPSYEEDR